MRRLLRDIAEIAAGQGAPQGDANYCDDGTPFVKAGNLSDLIGGLPIDCIQKVSDTVAKEHRLRLFPKGTVLFAKSGMSCTKGYVYVLPCDAYVVSHLACIIPIDRDMSSFLQYYFRYHKPNQLIKDDSYPSISLVDIGNLTIEMLDDEIRQRIVVELDRISSIIEARKKERSTLDILIKARFVEMFGECEELVPAGTIMSEMRNGISPSTSGQHHERVLTLSAITQGRFDPNMWKDGVFDTEPPTEKRISADDFYMCRGNGNKSLVGAGVYSSEDRRDLVFPDTVIAARVDMARVCLPYLFFAWMQPDVRDQIETGARTTNGTYKINQQVISKIKIPLPPLAQQKQFAAFVSQVDKSKNVVQSALNKAQLLFDSLMQKSFG